MGKYPRRLAGGEPGAVKFVIGVRAFGFIPFPLVDADHAPGMAGDAAIGKKIGRVGKDEVHGIFRHRGEDFQAIPLIDFDVVFGVVENRPRLRRRGFGGLWGGERGSGDGFGHGNGSGSLIKWERVSSE